MLNRQLSITIGERDQFSAINLYHFGFRGTEFHLGGNVDCSAIGVGQKSNDTRAIAGAIQDDR
jgi:hypothetical protein